MLEWLKDNVSGDALALLLAVATWAYHKVKGDKTESVKDIAWNALRGVAIKLAESDETVGVVREKLTAAAWAALSRAGVKKSKALEGIVSAVVDRGVSEVRERVLQRKQLEAKLMATLSSASDVSKAFTPPANPTVPPLGLNIEIVKPE